MKPGLQILIIFIVFFEKILKVLYSLYKYETITWLARSGKEVEARR